MIKGIDIYNRTGRPDFQRVKAAGIGYVILKATEGVNYTDASFAVNVEAAKAAGLPVGAYHFLRATPIDRQAHDFLAAIQGHGPYCCLAIDVENPCKNGKTIPEISNLGKTGITSRVITIYKAVRAAGYTCPVYLYSSASWLRNLIDVTACRKAGLLIWGAAYSNATPDNTDRSILYDMWQWSSNGSIPGITGNVDMDVCYRGIGIPNYTCDTAGTVEIVRGKAYQVEIACKGTPEVAAGTPDVVAVLPRSNDGDKHYYYIVPIGKPGDCVGIYINGEPKDFMIKIK
jgi:GH25 family lysozyme M1 (1,4-beta-N-acetylmuramidase)